jgi:hypothetical protein
MAQGSGPAGNNGLVKTPFNESATTLVLFLSGFRLKDKTAVEINMVHKKYFTLGSAFMAVVQVINILGCLCRNGVDYSICCSDQNKRKFKKAILISENIKMAIYMK